jgi:hypothetical protein
MRTTLTFNDELFRTLKIRAAEADETISQYVEDAVKYQLLEDAEDLEALEKTRNEPVYDFDDLVKKFKAEGLL